MNLIEGFEYFKNIQGTKYDKTKIDIKENLSNFRNNWKDFTNKTAGDNGLVDIKNGIGNWLKGDGRTIQEYLWNRYKVDGDDTNLVIYFNASSRSNEGIFISIGLIDDKLNDLEKSKSHDIYQYLQKQCSKIQCEGFVHVKTDWDTGDRVFKIENESKYKHLDYNNLLDQLKLVYRNTKNKFYSKSKIEENVEKNKKINQPLNQILYGPPGTGKTYNTINKALEIILDLPKEYNSLSDEGKESKLIEFATDIQQNNKDGIKLKNDYTSRDLLNAVFDFYKKQGQIEFVTFHQSYGYEEFVEGIKAKTVDKSIEYKVEPGIFQKISKKAKDNFENSRKSIDVLQKELSLKEKIETFLNDALETEMTFSKTKGGKFTIKELTDSEVIINTEDSKYSDKTLSLEIDELFKILDSNVELKTSRQMAKEVFDIKNQRQRDTYYLAICKVFKNTKFDESVKIEKEEIEQKYILIIDEINRGNISKIFGELITLIEPSKRIGEAEEIKLKLPYSGEQFGVPPNLYIIGTMNTADRSIAQIDTALRRRFVFEEMMPNSELLKDVIIDGIDIQEIINAINERIEYIYDREHTIGHSYFLPLQEISTKDKLDEIFRINIIPLLAEYFYGDWADIEFVLNNDFIKEKPQSKYITDNSSSRVLNKVYEINDTFTHEHYIKIYDTKEETN